MIKKTIIWISIVLVVSVLAYTFPLIYKLFVTQREITEVKFPQIGESLYLVSIRRGLSFEQTVISTSLRKNVLRDEGKSFVYKSGETLFYKIKSDTLVVYTMNKIAYPKELQINVHVEQIEITNLEFIDLNNRFKDIKLKRFPERK